MKVAIILSSNVWFAPYMKTYTALLDSYSISYDVISWNRDLSEPKSKFSYSLKSTGGKINRWREYWKYSKFVKNLLLHEAYDRIIIFGTIVPIMLIKTLITHFDKRYLLDYRDLSIEQMKPFKYLFSKLLNHSALNVVSSPGFIKYLPSSNYILSHNFDINNARKALTQNNKPLVRNKPIVVLTIGGIRDYKSNVEVIKGLANSNTITLKFVGKGLAASALEDFVKSNQITNVSFSGYYKKENEINIINSASFLNIFYPKIKSHSSALSNRFYHGLIERKPMIVTSNSIQGDYVEKYQLGLSLDNCDNLSSRILEFIQNFNSYEFTTNCNSLLSEFIKDYELFEKKVLTFVGCNG